MKLRFLITISLLISLFCILDCAYAANGDLMVDGNLTVGKPPEPNDPAPVPPPVKAEIYGGMVVDGNLGVGIEAPTEKAEIGGNLKVTGTIINNGETVNGNVVVNGTIRGATYGFGGMYSTSSCYGCRSANPFTQNCSCPPGFTAQWLQQFPEGNCGWYTGNMYVCYK